MNRETAEGIVKSLTEYFERVHKVTPDFYLADHNHEQLLEGSWSICWEGWTNEYGNEWAYVACNARMGSETGRKAIHGLPDKILFEPIKGCILGLHDLEGYWEAQEGLGY